MSHSNASACQVRLNPHYLCEWRDSCTCSPHELSQCKYWKMDLNGKTGIYYSPSGDYKQFTKDHYSKTNLQNNLNGCTTVHLLVFNVEKNELLFGLKWCKETEGKRKIGRHLLSFPSAKPYQRNGNMLHIVSRAFQCLTTDLNFADQCLQIGLKHRFLFQNANVIYPIYLTNEQALKLTQNFDPNSEFQEFQSLHWFSLPIVLSQLPQWSNYIETEEIESELAQIQEFHHIGIELGEHQLWSPIVTCLMGIREHLPGGFQTFLKI